MHAMHNPPVLPFKEDSALRRQEFPMMMRRQSLIPSGDEGSHTRFRVSFEI